MTSSCQVCCPAVTQDAIHRILSWNLRPQHRRAALSPWSVVRPRKRNVLSLVSVLPDTLRRTRHTEEWSWSCLVGAGTSINLWTETRNGRSCSSAPATCTTRPTQRSQKSIQHKNNFGLCVADVNFTVIDTRSSNTRINFRTCCEREPLVTMIMSVLRDSQPQTTRLCNSECTWT